jgi:hypothetical protein
MLNRLLPGAAFILTAVLFFGAGCGTNSAISPPPPLSPPTQPPNRMRLYLSQGSVFSLPITNSSIPVATIGANGSGMAFDSTKRLFVASNGQVQVFTQPIASGAVPAFNLATKLDVTADVAFDATGDLLVAGRAPGLFRVCFKPTNCFTFPGFTQAVRVFAPPIVGSSAPTFSLSGSGGPFVPVFAYQGVALDPSGDLWVTAGSALSEYTPPYSAGSVVALTTNEAGVGIAFDSAGKMFVAGSSGVDVFQPPFSAAMTKAFTINSAGPRYLAFDQAGNLYVTTQAGNLLEFSPPFSSVSVPSVALAIPGAPSNSGVAIGP